MLNKILKLRNRDANISDKKNYIKSSVLIPILENNNSLSLLFEVRSENLKKQPNEICFPGGGIEKEESPLDTAIREASEELCLPPKTIDVIGASDTLIAPFNNIIYAFIGILKDYKGAFNEEVKEVFPVPISYFLSHEPLCHYINVNMQPKKDFPFYMIQNGKDYRWSQGKYPVYFYTYENRIIWGITARIIHDFVSLIEN